MERNRQGERKDKYAQELELCGAVWCSVLQCVAGCWNVLQSVCAL